MSFDDRVVKLETYDYARPHYPTADTANEFLHCYYHIVARLLPSHRFSRAYRNLREAYDYSAAQDSPELRDRTWSGVYDALVLARDEARTYAAQRECPTAPTPNYPSPDTSVAPTKAA